MIPRDTINFGVHFFFLRKQGSLCTIIELDSWRNFELGRRVERGDDEDNRNSCYHESFFQKICTPQLVTRFQFICVVV